MTYSGDNMTTPTRYAQYSSPKLNDYYSTSTPTAVQQLSYNSSSDYYYYYSTPTLYSKEDHIRIRRRKEKLQADVIALQKKYKQLKQEAKRIKNEKVSEGEVTFLQAETNDELSKNNSSKLDSLVADLFDQIQAEAAAKAYVDVFDRSVKEMSKQRKYCMDESKAISDLFDFSELQIMIPHIRNFDRNQFMVKEEDIEDDIYRAKRMQKEIVRLSNPTELSQAQSDAATSVSQLFQKQLELASYHLPILKADVHHLQKFSEEQEVINKEKSVDAESIRQQYQTMELEKSQDEKLQNAEFQQKQAFFESQYSLLDQEIEELNNQIEQSGHEFDEIIQNIEQLKEEKNILLNSDKDTADFLIRKEIYSDYSSSEFEEEEDQKEEVQLVDLNKETMKELATQKESLMNEVAQLQIQLASIKKDLLAKENKLKTKLKTLYEQLSRNQSQIKKLYAFQEFNSSSIHDDLTNIMNHIGDSINQLKSGFSDL